MDPNDLYETAKQDKDSKNNLSVLQEKDSAARSWYKLTTKKVAIQSSCKDILVPYTTTSISDSKAVFHAQAIVPPHDTFYFNFSTYKNTEVHKGVAVTFNVQCNGKSYMMFSDVENGLIRFKPGEIPVSIEGTQSEFIFFQTLFDTRDQYYKFESSSFPGSYQARSSEKEIMGHDLVLEHHGEDVAETCKLTIVYLSE
ncbi:interleukin-18-like isoform X1 [Pleurodeles waltl]